jgi:RNA polymerase sigma factor (sigma-70 family)
VTIGDRFPEMLEAARAGDPAALETLYRDLAPSVLGYLRAQGAAESEDLASDAFVGVVRGLRRFRGDEKSFRSWVFSIAHRRLVDERRGLARRREYPVDPAGLATAAGGRAAGDAEAEALAEMGTRWAREAVSRLSPDQRSVVLLRVMADLSVEEVARILGKTVGAVKSLQRRGVLALARQIDPEGVS